MDSVIRNNQFQTLLTSILDNFNKIESAELDNSLENLIDIIMSIINSKFKDSENFISLSEELKKEILKNIKIIIASLIKSSKKDIAQLVLHTFIETFNKTKKRENKVIFKLREKDRKKIEELLKKIAIYEEYKAQNPKAIAGETKFENFLHNINLIGLEKAMKYEGGREKDIRSYSKHQLEEIARASKNSKERGGWNR